MEGNPPNSDSASKETGNASIGDRGGQRDRRGGGGRGDRQSRGRGRGGGRGRGSDRGRGSGRGRGTWNEERGSKRTKDMGRGAYTRMDKDKREQINDSRERREKNGFDGPNAGVLFSKEEIDGEARKPKKKVAVMIGYAGSGYKGMQINALEKTIEGDLFKAFVMAGAISKANADDPKKSSLVRCARTDKGVHAAGNVISLKLIVEDEKIVEKINEHLPPQIRVWGMERTNGAFSCYQSCDSRWYEYLIPTFCFIPPHPESYLGKKLVESATNEGTLDAYLERQQDAASFWKGAEEVYIQPILEKLDPELRASVIAAIHSADENDTVPPEALKDDRSAIKSAVDTELAIVKEEGPESTLLGKRKAEEEADTSPLPKKTKAEEDTISAADTLKAQDHSAEIEKLVPDLVDTGGVDIEAEKPAEDFVRPPLSPFDAAIKDIKAAYIAAKKTYRISEARRARVQEALNAYLGTKNFHNYTVQKKFSDPSAKRVIRSFNAGKDPVIINDTEWLSLKVHGQSFMMHQIRKMIAMASLVVRCGTATSIIQDSYGPATISIPKAPGLGLLLERPVFSTYNERAKREFEREPIDFDLYQKEMDEFKQREIYDRIFREEEKDHQFHAFFHHIDHYRTDYFLWVTAGGLSAAKQSTARREVNDDDDELPDAKGEEG